MKKDNRTQKLCLRLWRQSNEEMSDDFLWDVALRNGRGVDTTWLVPGREEQLLKSDNTFPTEHILLPRLRWHESHEIVVRINEIRDFGVCDIIGGEVWQGSLLLTSYLIHHKELFLSKKILELGSGVSIPGLVLVWLMVRSKASPSGSVCFTDYEVSLLHNLSDLITSEYPPAEAQLLAAKPPLHDNINVSIRRLDWFNSVDLTQLLQEEPLFDVIIGSELVYSPDHAIVANIINVASGKSPEAYILQLRERPGVTELFLRLTALNLKYECIDIPADIVTQAQQIVRYEASCSSRCGSYVHIPLDSNRDKAACKHDVSRRLFTMDPDLFILIHITK